MSLCFNTEVPKSGSWSSKQKRAYHRIKSGVRMAELRGVPVRFLTLSTSDTQSLNVNARRLNDDFRVLKYRIKRLTVDRLIKNGYITEKKACRKYGPNKIIWSQPFTFENFKVLTNEGNGVLHILFQGAFIPYNWLVDNWLDIHNSWNVDIRMFRGDLARYVATQYMAGQSGYVRSSWSWGWCYKGFVKDWKKF